MTNKTSLRKRKGNKVKRILGKVLEFFTQEAAEFVIVGVFALIGFSTYTVLNGMVGSLGGVLIVKVIRAVLSGGLR